MGKVNEIVQRSNDAVVPHVEAERLSDASFRASQRTSRELINAMPKVTVRIPLPPDITEEEAIAMPKPPHTPVGINGYTWQVRHGVDVEVPQEVANILRRSGKA